MGGRSLLNAPLDVLRTQLAELRVFLADAPWAEALHQAGVDPVRLVADVDETVVDATAALLSLRLAHRDVERLTDMRSAWRASYVAWVAEVRAALKLVAPLAPEAVDDVRTRFSRYTGRSFRPSHQSLQLAVAGLRTYAEALCVHRWSTDPLSSGEALLSAAKQIVADGNRLERVRAQRSREAAAMSTRVKGLLGRIRAAWAVAQLADPYLPDLPLHTLAAYSRRQPPAAAYPRSGRHGRPQVAERRRKPRHRRIRGQHERVSAQHERIGGQHVRSRTQHRRIRSQHVRIGGQHR